MTEIFKIKKWHNMTELPYWGSKEANMLNGTDGNVFHPELFQNEKLDVFVDSLFRSATLVYAGDYVENGVILRRYELAPELLMNATLRPENAAFYAFGPSGVLNMSTINQAPLFASKPHFLDADPVYTSKFTGLDPDADEHDTFLGVEPYTGATMGGAKRLQINFIVDSTNPKMPLRNTLHPVLWVEEGPVMPQAVASKIKGTLYLANDAADAAYYAGIIAGSGILGLAAIMAIYMTLYKPHVYRKKRATFDKEPLMGDKAYRSGPSETYGSSGSSYSVYEDAPEQHA
eukprot:Colp12_sorted_trinity150504_noHs@2734